MPEHRLQKKSRILNHTGRYAVNPFLLTSFTSSITRTGGGSSRSGGLLSPQSHGLLLLVGVTERMAEIRRFGGEKESRGGGKIIGEDSAPASTWMTRRPRVLVFLADRLR